jgi:hypothetical protein
MKVQPRSWEKLCDHGYNHHEPPFHFIQSENDTLSRNEYIAAIKVSVKLIAILAALLYITALCVPLRRSCLYVSFPASNRPEITGEYLELFDANYGNNPRWLAKFMPNSLRLFTSRPISLPEASYYRSFSDLGAWTVLCSGRSSYPENYVQFEHTISDMIGFKRIAIAKTLDGITISIDKNHGLNNQNCSWILEIR